jgi:hypothetical protein
MLHRLLPANATLIDRWGHLLYWLFEGMALDWRRRGLRHVHHPEICQRIVGMWKRLRSVIARFEAGKLRPPRARAVRLLTLPPDPLPNGEGDSNCRSGWRSVLPRRFGWLKSLISPERQHHVIAFNLLIHEDAEMQAIIAAAPAQIGRVLRPFCHFLGLAVPEALRLPKRVRDPRLRRRRAAAASRLRDARSEMIVPNRRLPPREQAEDAVRRSEATGKPIDVRRFSAVAYGWFVHPPRDGNCPPPEIGYGGRLRPLPKDYNPPRDE